MRTWRLVFVSEKAARQTNDDAGAVSTFKHTRRRYFVVVVADGVGSMRGSAVCAQAVAVSADEAARIFFRTRRTRRPFVRSDCAAWARVLTRHLANMQGDPSQAATLAVALFGYRSALITWAGDSRIYLLYRDGTFTCVTRDHNDQNGEITHYVRGDGFVATRIETRLFSMDQVVAVAATTDGVHDHCSTPELRQFLLYCIGSTSRSRPHIGRELTAFLQQNLSDNATFALAHRHIPARRVFSMARLGSGIRHAADPGTER